MSQHTAFSGEPALYLHITGHSETGHLLAQNADAFALYDVSDPRQAERLGRLYLLADGTGEEEAGHLASRIAIQTIPAVYYHQSEDDSPLVRLQQAFLVADARIREFAARHREYAQMVTSCTAVVIAGTRIWIAHIGDSRAYLVRTRPQAGPTITRLTTDHSMTAARVRSGALSPEQMRHSPVDRDILLRALGGGEENHPYADFVMYDAQPGDVLILCSDGLWGAIPEEQIARVVCAMSPQRACEKLVQIADDAAGDENISIIMLSFSQGVSEEANAFQFLQQ